MFIPDKFARTVRLLVKIVDGQVLLADGSPLPKLKDDSRGELVLFSVYSLTNENDREFYAAEHEVPFLKKGTFLWARVNNDPITKDLAKFRVERRKILNEPFNFVQFEIESDLSLIRKPGKNSVLSRCLCSMHALPDTATSINEAYTKISTVFEPNRRSHTGNVFQNVFVEDNGALVPLGDMRTKAELKPLPEKTQEGLF